MPGQGIPVNQLDLDRFLAQFEQPKALPTAEERIAARRDLENRQLRAFLNLSTAEGQALSDHALRLWDQGRKSVADDLLHQLAAWVPGALEASHDGLFRRNILQPGDLFRRADPPIRDKLLARTDEFTERRIDLRVLVALAWIGDHEVQRVFRVWRDQPPPWSTKLPFGIDSITTEAGWTLTQSGQRRDLYSEVCFQLVPKDMNGQKQDSEAVIVLTSTLKTCHWCGRNLLALLEIDASRPEAEFVGWSGRKLPIAMCEACTPYAAILTDVSSDGDVVWNAANVRPSHLPADPEVWWPLPRGTLQLGPPRTNPFEANLFNVSEGLSQLGGHPSWQQSAEYPRCPGCQYFMPFIGQVHVEDLEPFSEGTYYGFFCVECGMAATVYQQT
jgi:hypothetical protein